ncbi:PAS domain-containing sensor histidine kinase [Terrisporobacter mayombei]|uniref:histidine kinase n=1 Tax=Terrisporobacter mayombei TaxID=1541 RepID=A0ABY9Q0N1_9FIRM|nr:HAMP domain-containing sensor histidine kinase [Terrisporobacter mayombei]MCC3867253.1 HAMP domain-containing histidine kinase [Terrisporobacter mayombei]WMT81515.1 Adaptive-response sensory-kinase SasA [Terrisporobacter mayombei]
MILNEYGELLYLLKIITNIAIPLLLIFIYKISKDKNILLILPLFFLDLLIMQLKEYNIRLIMNYATEISSIVIFLKLLILFQIKIKSKSSLKKYITPLIFTIGLVYTVLYGSMTMDVIYEILINLCILSIICINVIYIKHKENELNKNKFRMNKQYISRTIKEVENETYIQNYMREEIKTVNDKLASIVEVINIPIIILNAFNYKCIFKNKYFDEFIIGNNYNVENFDFSDFISNELNKDPKNIFDQISKMDFGKENFLQIEFVNKKYKLVLVKDYFEGGETIICELKDITEISIEEDKLKKSELRYKTLMDILSDGVLIHDGDNISYINKIGMDIFDLDSSIKNVWTMDKIEKRISKDSKDEFLHNIFVLKNGDKEQEKSQLELENGKIIDFISSTFRLNGKKMILSIASDCTEHEVALNKLDENKETYYGLIQTLPEGIILVNKYTKKQVYTNKYMMRLLKDMGLDNFNKIIDTYLENNEEVNFKTFYMNQEKNKKISIAIEQVPKQDNLLVIVRDLEIEQQLESVYNKLRMIKERNKFKTEFLTRASSIIKKPINTIFEVNKFLDNNKDIYNYDGVRSYTKTVKQNSYRLKRLLNNIEEISKIEAGIYYRDYKIYDIVKYLEELVQLCRAYTKPKNLDITFESNKREVLIFMDKEKIEKIILNLLSNAIKFTEKGGKIKVSLKVDKKDITIAIKDNGSGIPSNKLDFIFENFEQVNRSLSRTAEGTGVGLYLVKKLALVHHAKIQVNSKIGYGSKFEVILKGNYLESTKENKHKIENIIIDRESIDLEFSDIYLA